MTDIFVRQEGHAGRITLDRPRALNALTLPMIRAIDAALTAWEADDTIRLVIIDGAGERGFCAGGDIRVLYDAAVSGDRTAAQVFFRDEYRLNAHIATLRKPYVALMDGIVMGGGIGLSAHGRYRVVTERSRLGMPEVGIGFLPDVGGTWLLGRAPGRLGDHLALTGGQFGPADAMLCGLADLCVPSGQLPALAAALAGCGDAPGIEACLQAHAVEPPSGTLAQSRGWIDGAYADDRVEDIVAALAGHDQEDARRTAATIAGKCPTSLKVALRAVREAPALGCLEACLETEYRLALALLAEPDFREGVRAAVVDKDRRPAWSPATLEAVSQARVEAIFAAPDHGGLGLGKAFFSEEKNQKTL